MFLQDRCCLGVLPERVQMSPELLYVRQEPVCICKIASCLRASSATLSSGCPSNSRRHPPSHAATCRAAHPPLPTRTMSPEPWNVVGRTLKVLSCRQHPPSTWLGMWQHTGCCSAASGALPWLAEVPTRSDCPLLTGLQQRQEREVAPCPAV